MSSNILGAIVEEQEFKYNLGGMTLLLKKTEFLWENKRSCIWGRLWFFPGNSTFIFKRVFEEDILAFSRAHIIGKPDSEILYSVENTGSLIRHRCGKEQVGTSQVERSFSQNQEEFHSLQEFELETNFKRSLLKSKS